MRIRPHSRFVVCLFVAVLCGTLTAFAYTNGETGRLKIHVSPKQAYVFVDGKAIREGDQTIELAAGTHQVGVDNYGYVPKTQKVHIGAGETTKINVALQSTGAVVAGPFGDIEIKGDPRAAVLLNGKTPAYFVGHVDEFNWNWIWHQRLLVHAGTYQVEVTRKGNTLWAGPVTVKAGQQVTIYTDHDGKMKMKSWREGDALPPQPRFHAGIASATVPVAPVSAQLSAQESDIGCGQPTDLSWKSDNAVQTEITGLGTVGAEGNRSVDPTRTTTYELTATGPGGIVTKTVAVDVKAEPTAQISLGQREIHFHKVGDKIVEDQPTTLSWSTANANSVTITPLGHEADSGSATIEAKPVQTNIGPVDENFGYTIKASNACGGTATRTVLLHVIGSIDPPPEITLASLFYPTNYPTRRDPKLGLLHSEQQTLAGISKRFENYRTYNDKAALLIVGHTDVRRSARYNLALSERRANLVKSYLIAQGVAADEIEIRAVGKTQQLPEKEVAILQKDDAQKPEKLVMHSTRDTWLAYNRRVDVVLEPGGQKPVVAYPNDASDLRVLWEPQEPSLKKVEMAEQGANKAGSLHAALASN